MPVFNSISLMLGNFFTWTLAGLFDFQSVPNLFYLKKAAVLLISSVCRSLCSALFLGTLVSIVLCNDLILAFTRLLVLSLVTSSMLV